MLASNWHQWSRRYGTSLCIVFCKKNSYFHYSCKSYTIDLELSLTFQIPRIWIFAIISAVNSNVMEVSTMNVTYWRIGIFSNVFGVLSDMLASDNRAHIRMSLRTHSCEFLFIKEKEKELLPKINDLLTFPYA